MKSITLGSNPDVDEHVVVTVPDLGRIHSLGLPSNLMLNNIFFSIFSCDRSKKGKPDLIF